MASEVLACENTQEESVTVLPDVSQRKPFPDEGDCEPSAELGPIGPMIEERLPGPD